MNARRSALRSFQELIFGGHSQAAPGKAHAEFRPPDLLRSSSALSTRSVTRMVVPSGPEHPLDATRERSPCGPTFDSGAHLRRTFPSRIRHGTCRVSAPRSAALTTCTLDTQRHALLGSSFQLHPDLHRRPLPSFREPIFGHRAPRLQAWAHAGFGHLYPPGTIWTLNPIFTVLVPVILTLALLLVWECSPFGSATDSIAHLRTLLSQHARLRTCRVLASGSALQGASSYSHAASWPGPEATSG